MRRAICRAVRCLRLWRTGFLAVTAFVARLTVSESSTAPWSAAASGGLTVAGWACAPDAESAAGRIPVAADCAAALDGQRPIVPAAAAASARPDTANLTFL